MTSRLKKGIEGEQLFKDKLNKLGIKFIKTGREDLIKDPSFSALLTSSDSATAAFFRYLPDFYLHSKDFFFAEVKYSTTIEKKCYDRYLEIEQGKNEIFIFFLIHKTFHFCKPSEVPFYTYPSQDGWMKHIKTNLFLPVEDQWIFPQELSAVNLEQFKKVMNSSGLSYAHICVDTLKTFKKL